MAQTQRQIDPEQAAQALSFIRDNNQRNRLAAQIGLWPSSTEAGAAFRRPRQNTQANHSLNTRTPVTDPTQAPTPGMQPVSYPRRGDQPLFAGALRRITAEQEPLPSFEFPKDYPEIYHMPVPDIFTKHDLKMIGLTPFERKLVEAKGITLQQAQAIEERIEMMMYRDDCRHHHKHLHDLSQALHTAILPFDPKAKPQRQPEPRHPHHAAAIVPPHAAPHGPTAM